MLYSQTFTKKNPYFFQNGGARARRAGPGSAFASSKDVEKMPLKDLQRYLFSAFWVSPSDNEVKKNFKMTIALVNIFIIVQVVSGSDEII